MILIAIIEIILVALVAALLGWAYNTGEVEEQRANKVKNLELRMDDVEKKLSEHQNSIGTAYQNLAELTGEFNGMDSKFERAVQSMQGAAKEMKSVADLLKEQNDELKRQNDLLGGANEP